MENVKNIYKVIGRLLNSHLFYCIGWEWRAFEKLLSYKSRREFSSRRLGSFIPNNECFNFNFTSKVVSSFQRGCEIFTLSSKRENLKRFSALSIISGDVPRTRTLKKRS